MRNEQLIRTLYDCVAKCNYCADACLDEDNIKMMVECIRLDRICASVCESTALALSTNSKSDVKSLVQACQDACKKCGDECAKHETQHCKDCAEACRKCEEACRNYAA